MTPSPHQQGDDGADFPSEEHRMVAEKNEATIWALLKGVDDLERARNFHDAVRGRDDLDEEIHRLAARLVSDLQPEDGTERATA